LELTRSNQEIQKIIAFEGVFEMLLSIIEVEGMSDGGIIVQDCLRLLINLLSGNVSNQVCPFGTKMELKKNIIRRIFGKLGAFQRHWLC
jgi:hypothetical protein